MNCSPKLSRPLIFGPYGRLPVGCWSSIGGQPNSTAFWDSHWQRRTSGGPPTIPTTLKNLLTSTQRLKRKCFPPKRGSNHHFTLYTFCKNHFFVNITFENINLLTLPPQENLSPKGQNYFSICDHQQSSLPRKNIACFVEFCPSGNHFTQALHVMLALVVMPVTNVSSAHVVFNVHFEHRHS